jgi:hypothetical protein
LYYNNDNTTKTIGTFKNTNNAFIVSINGAVLPAFSPTSDEQSIGIARIRQAENQVKIYSRIETGNTFMPDPSFEKSIPGTVGDCNN